MQKTSSKHLTNRQKTIENNVRRGKMAATIQKENNIVLPSFPSPPPPKIHLDVLTEKSKR